MDAGKVAGRAIMEPGRTSPVPVLTTKATTKPKPTTRTTTKAKRKRMTKLEKSSRMEPPNKPKDLAPLALVAQEVPKDQVGLVGQEKDAALAVSVVRRVPCDSPVPS